MQLDFLGGRLDLSLLDGSSEAIDLLFEDKLGKVIGFSDCSFYGHVIDSVGRTSDMVIEQDAKKELISLYFPQVEAGAYLYEVWIVSDGGEQLLVRGRLGVLKTLRAFEAVREQAERRSFRLRVPAVSSGMLQIEAIASSISVSAARQAAAAAAAAQEAAEKLEGVESKLDEARREALEEIEDKKREELEAFERESVEVKEKGLAELEEKKGLLESLIEQLNSLQSMIDEIKEDIRSSCFVDADTGHLFIGGLDTGAQVVGEPGKSPWVDSEGVCHWWDDAALEWKETVIKGDDGFSPYISADGYWVTKNKHTGEEEKTDIRAAGRDGMDGAAIKRTAIGSLTELPSPPDPRCNSSNIFYLTDSYIKEWKITRGSGAICNVYIASSDMEQRINATGGNIKELYMSFISKLLEEEIDDMRAYYSFADDALHVFIEGENARNYSLNSYVGVNVDQRVEKKAYSEYAWAESESGGGWYIVPNHEAVASTQAHGVVKLGTDITISGGAPVGFDDNEALHVPIAEITMPGAVKVGIETEGEGSGLFVDKDGVIHGVLASIKRAGAVRISYDGECGAAVVGFTENGGLGLPWGRPEQPGIFGVAAPATSTLESRHLVHVQVGGDHNLKIQLDPTGALEWVGGGWLGGIEGVNQTEYFLRLKTGEGLHIDEDKGLTVTRGAAGQWGVVAIGSMDYPDDNSVPTTLDVFEWANETFGKKEDFLSIKEADETIARLVAEKMGEYALLETLKDYITKKDADELYMPKLGVPVKVYTNPDDYPAIEDQEEGIVYFGVSRK